MAVTTRVYRNAVDAAWEELLQKQQQQEQNNHSLSAANLAAAAAVKARIESSKGASSSSSGSSKRTVGSSNSSSSSSSGWIESPGGQLAALQQVFARAQDETYGGLTPGFLAGVQHQMLVRGRSPRHRGLCLGRVTRVTKRGVILGDLMQPVKRGDGVVFDRGVPEEGEEGGNIWEIFDTKGRKAQGVLQKGEEVELVFGPHQVYLPNISPGDLVWKNLDPVLEGEIRKTYDGLSATACRKVPVAVAVSGAIGKPLQLQLTDDQGLVAVADTGEVVLQPAKQRGMSEKDVWEGVGQLGDNVLQPASLDMSGLQLQQGRV